MKEYIISTDSTADLSREYIKENNIMIHPISYMIDDVTYAYGARELTDEEFYNEMRQGKMPVTGASNPAQITELMTEAVQEGKEILHLSFSSGISSSYNNAAVSARNIMEEIPGSKIIVIDSLCVTAGQAVIVKKAVELKKQGMSIDELASWLEEHKRQVVHEFSVQDLFHLVRGGRLSKTSAALGTVLKIQPILHVTNEGTLENIAKVRGRKKAIATMVEDMRQKTEGMDVDEIYITHGDCLEDARELAREAKEVHPNANVEIAMLCPTIGAHTGPGVIVLSYFGAQR